ncbi:hypothetical protein A1O1_06326 [Capronia coronata CBS 617.96]|uniref:RING-type domain-containing protein n=1 Tax=Capronia coronata CBS 617.96 TaxID=1182541 RepID=W9XZJ1_9EURO|nr:uncharacterized protein A1O1_06326 [Capronia coronata CBS 617.96]EXJ85957.1 hypothetical protein A1O1_06326 [Capronia coronata CBS 617.96]
MSSDPLDQFLPPFPNPTSARLVRRERRNESGAVIFTNYSIEYEYDPIEPSPAPEVVQRDDMCSFIEAVRKFIRRLRCLVGSFLVGRQQDITYQDTWKAKGLAQDCYWQMQELLDQIDIKPMTEWLHHAEHTMTLILARGAVIEHFLVTPERDRAANQHLLCTQYRLEDAVVRTLRAEFRNLLDMEIDDLSTPRLNSIRYKGGFVFAEDHSESDADAEEEENDEHTMTIDNAINVDDKGDAMGIDNSDPDLMEDVVATTLEGQEAEEHVHQSPIREDDIVVCAICKEDFSHPDNRWQVALSQPVPAPLFTHPCCNQAFHATCLINWLQPTAIEEHKNGSCPCCRGVLDDEFMIKMMDHRTKELGTL